MRLAFVYTPFHEIKNQPSIKEVSKNYGVYPPINLAYVAGVAKHSGHEVTIIDANALELSKKDLLSRIRKFQPDAILLTITTYLFHQTLGWIRFLKKNTDAYIIVGGVHTTQYPKETLSHEEIDYAIIGDSENTMPKLLNAIEKNKDISKVRNIAMRYGGNIKVNGRGDYCNFIESVYPLRELLPNERYHEFISQRKNFTGMITTRGCPFRCTFCEQGSKNFFWKREIKDVMVEIQECYHENNIREIDFFDPIFTLDKKRTIEICKSIKRLGLDIDYAIRTRTDCVDDKIISVLRRSGCKRIYYGLESSNPGILKNMNKNADINQTRRAVKLTNKHGINAFGYFMFGSKGETLRTMRESLKFSLSLGLAYAQYNKTVALAGTEMYNELMKDMGYDFWSRYTLEKEEPDWIIPRLGTNLTDAQIEREVAKAYRKFYFRPGYIMKRMLNLKSYDEFKRYARAAASFL